MDMIFGTVEEGNFEWVSNFEQNKRFLVLTIASPFFIIQGKKFFLA